MTDKTRADFEAWYLSETGITYQDAVDRGVYDLQFLQRCWEAGTIAERKNLATAIEAHAEKLHQAMANGKTLGEKHNVITLGKIEVLTDIAAAIRRGGEA